MRPRPGRSSSRLAQAFDSGWLLALAGLLALPIAAIQGCEGSTGPCSAGECPQLTGCETTAPICDPEHVCLEQVCEGIGWICGVREEGGKKIYGWARSSAPCSDGDPCTSGDVCVGGACRGRPMVCETPPPSLCLDAGRLQAYQPGGTCQEGSCEYPSKEIACAQGCAEGKCVGEPCLGVSCTTPPGPCHESPGTCEQGSCSYALRPAATPCQPSDLCRKSGSCDEQGNCAGEPITCESPNATAGTCVQGTCQGFACLPGYGNCNDSWDDGCETPLNTTSNCGKCGLSCGPAKNASVACTAGKCTLSCSGSYRDCDGLYSTGCEIPVGVPNTCNLGGLATLTSSSGPCGTAYCGSATGTRVKNFGKWHCVFCSTCHKFSSGYSWCLAPGVTGSGSGNYSSDRCASCCGTSSLNLVCKP